MIFREACRSNWIEIKRTRWHRDNQRRNLKKTFKNQIVQIMTFLSLIRIESIDDKLFNDRSADARKTISKVVFDSSFLNLCKHRHHIDLNTEFGDKRIRILRRDVFVENKINMQMLNEQDKFAREIVQLELKLIVFEKRLHSTASQSEPWDDMRLKIK